MHKVYTVRPASLFNFLLRVFLFLLVMNFISIATDAFFTQTGRSSYFIDTFVIKLFYFDGEKNIPAYFSTFNLFLCAGLCFIISKADKTRYHKRWFYLAFVFIFLAFDELISIHEVLTGPSRAIVQKLLGSKDVGILYYAWVVPYAVLLLIAAVYFYRFVFSLPKKILINFIIAAGIFVAGAIGMELVGGYVAEKFGMTGFAFQLSSTIEESLEMLGIIFFARTLMQYMAMQPDAIDLRFNFNEGLKNNERPLETYDRKALYKQQ